jgi:hypothetical protein
MGLEDPGVFLLLCLGVRIGMLITTTFLPPEDPAPDNGNPHPMHGVEVTAEQIYQNQLNIW